VLIRIAILAEHRPLTPTGGPFILIEMWGYAEGNGTLVGIVVVIVAIAAIVYVTMRVLRRGR
jgi:uncharacterized membrane protein